MSFNAVCNLIVNYFCRQQCSPMHPLAQQSFCYQNEAPFLPASIEGISEYLHSSTDGLSL